jgi:gliding-associated putative ABC transporter substrate-binding component GldG
MATKKTIIQSQSIVFIVVILGFIAVVNYLATTKFLRADLTQSKMYSLSATSKSMMRKLDDIVNINVYFSKNLPTEMKLVEADVRDLLAEYQAYSGNKLKIKWQDPAESEEVKRRAQELGIREVQMQTYEKDKVQAINAFMGIAVLYADKKEILPFIGRDMTNFEYEMTQSIMKVVRKSTPKVGVLKTDTSAFIPQQIRMQMRMNQNDATEEKYKPLFDELKKNYEVETVDISSGQKIDSTIRTLIVPGGEVFTDRKLFEIDQYFMNGGNLIVLADAVKVSFQYGPMGQPVETKILNLMEHYGARVEKNMVLDAACGQVQIPQQVGPFQMNVAAPYPYFVRILKEGFDAKNPAVGSLDAPIILPWASSITLLVGKADSSGNAGKSQDVKGTVLVKSSKQSWTEAGNFNLNPQQDWKPNPASLKTNNMVVYLHGSFSSYFTGKSVPPVKETPDSLGKITLNAEDQNRVIRTNAAKGNLVVAGTSNFVTAQNGMPGNLTLLINLVDWLSQDDNLIQVRTRAIIDRSIRRDDLKKGSAMPGIIRWINILLMPALLILAGLAIYARRREPVAGPGRSTTAEKKEEAK